MKPMILVVMIPAFNEEKTIGNVIREIPRKIEGIDEVKVLVINDGSNDDTVKAAGEAGADVVVSHPRNLGLGVAFRNGLEQSISLGADVIVNIDADGQYDPLQIPDLVTPVLEKRADIVLGWRDIDSLNFMPRGKKLGNKLATWVTRITAGLPVKDAQSGYRAFSRDAALRMNLTGKYTYVQETLMQARYKGLWVEQMRVDFRERVGQSRLITSLASYAFKAGRTILLTLKDYRPLWLFGTAGGVLTLAGLGFAIRVLVHYVRTEAVSPHIPSAIAASLLIIVGLVVLFFGVLADMFRQQRLLEEEILYRLKKGGNGGLIDRGNGC